MADIFQELNTFRKNQAQGERKNCPIDELLPVLVTLVNTIRNDQGQHANDDNRRRFMLIINSIFSACNNLRDSEDVLRRVKEIISVFRDNQPAGAGDAKEGGRRRRRRRSRRRKSRKKRRSRRRKSRKSRRKSRRKRRR